MQREGEIELIQLLNHLILC